MNEDPFLNDPDVLQAEINVLFSRYKNSNGAIKRYEALKSLVVSSTNHSFEVKVEIGIVSDSFFIFKSDLLMAVTKKLDAARIENVESFNQLHVIREALAEYFELSRGRKDASDGRDS